MIDAVELAQQLIRCPSMTPASGQVFDLLAATPAADPGRLVHHARLAGLSDAEAKDVRVVEFTNNRILDEANIAEIGGIRVLRIRSEGKHNKRVEITLSGSG